MAAKELTQAHVPFIIVLASTLSAVMATCSGSTYSYGGAECSSCPSGATFVSATAGCQPSAMLTSGPTDTAFYISGSAVEGVAAFPNAPSVSSATDVFGVSSGALSFTSGAGFLSMTPAAGSTLLASLPTGDSPFSVSAWVKCEAGSAMPTVWWGVPTMSGVPSPSFVTLAGGTAYFYDGKTLMAGTVTVLARGFNYSR